MRRKILYGFQFVPFTLNAVVCGLFVWAAYAILYRPAAKVADEETLDSFRPFVILMGKVLFWFILALIALSILTTLATWLYYLVIRKTKRIGLQLDYTNEKRNKKTSKLFLQAELPGVIRPLLGFVKARLYYDDYKLTDSFPLLSNKRQPHRFWRLGILGKSRMALPDIKEYEVKGGFVFFEDMLRIFSFAAPEKVHSHFYQPPVLQEDLSHDVFPKKTETLDVRIDEMRRVEGEPLNYKDFESGDDVRRIVWKVYAKNRDLVVRIPERFEPYASHLYLYASFHAGIKKEWLGEAYFREMLNYYKNSVYTVYDALSKKEWEMRYISDQPYTPPDTLDEKEKVERTISNSDWQQDPGLLQYFSPRQATVLCISSLTDPAELESILDNNLSTIIYFAKLSQTFHHWVAWNWLKRLLLQPPKDRLNKLRTSWTFSATRIRIRKREKEIEKLLKECGVEYFVV